jgi:hypothetical protein
MPLSPVEREQLRRIEQDLAASRRLAPRMSERRWRAGLARAVLAVAATDLETLAIIAETQVNDLPGAGT